MQFVKVGQNRERGFAAPTITQCLKIIIGRTEFPVWFFGFDKKPDVMKIRCQKKSIISAALRTSFIALDFHFLFVGIFLRAVVHIPAERDEKFVNEILARLRFGKLWRQVKFLVGLKISHELFYLLKCFVESRWHWCDVSEMGCYRQADKKGTPLLITACILISREKY
ncbi:MAG TPA: hypothetical protein VGI63_08640 [Verrucomicrobiae bacterium]